MLLLDFINVGYGDAILIRDTEEPFTMLVDCGDVSVGNGGPDSKRIPAADYLRREGIETLDLLVLTHLHRDHIGGLTEVISAARVQELWTNYLPQESDWGRCIAVPENFSAGSRCLLQSLNIFLDTLKLYRVKGPIFGCGVNTRRTSLLQKPFCRAAYGSREAAKPAGRNLVGRLGRDGRRPGTPGAGRLLLIIPVFASAFVMGTTVLNSPAICTPPAGRPMIFPNATF